MSLEDKLSASLDEYNTSNLSVSDVQLGDSAGINVSFTMTDPLGLDTGDLSFNANFVKYPSLTDDKVVWFVQQNAARQAQALVFDREGELR